MNSGWVTNNTEAGMALRAADRAFGDQMAAASGMRLADKVIAIRAAKAARTAAYARVSDFWSQGE